MSLVSTSATSRPGYADVYGRFWERVGREPLPGEMDHLLSIWERMGWNDVFAQMDVFKAQTPATGGLTPGNATPRGVGFRRAGGFGNLSFGGPSFTPPPVPSGAGGGWRGAVTGAVGGVATAAAGSAADYLRRRLFGGGAPPALGPGPTSASGPAPTATFFGGECPPGRVLRRVSMGRDICIKKPRMNPFNPRALARADRRVTSFARRSKAILQDLGFTVSARKAKGINKKRRRR